MEKEKQLYEVEIKSQALLRENKKGLVTYFRGGKKKTIVMNVQKLYPQYTNPDDAPVVNITPICEEEYNKRVGVDFIRQKQHLMKVHGDLSEIMGN